MKEKRKNQNDAANPEEKQHTETENDAESNEGEWDMAAPVKPIKNIVVKMNEKEYNDFIEYATTNKKINYTPEQIEVMKRFKKFQSRKK